MMSLATPAGIGTTTVTLRVGQSWADAWPKAANAMAAPRATCRAIFIVISSKTRTKKAWVTADASSISLPAQNHPDPGSSARSNFVVI